MKKMRALLSTERLLVLAAVIVSIVLALSKMIGGVDRFIYDAATPFLNTVSDSDIALIAIDDRSIESLGRWPWSRNIHAQLIKKLNAAEPKIIVANVLFSEEELDQELTALKKIRASLSDTQVYKGGDKGGAYVPGAAWLSPDIVSDDLLNASRQSYVAMQHNMVTALGDIDRYIAEMIDTTSGDANLAQAITPSPPVLMPLFFHTDKTKGHAATMSVTENSVTFLVQGSFSTKRQNLPPNIESVISPIPALASHAGMMGHINYYADTDGKLRTHKLLIHHNGQLYPSLALATMASSLGYSAKEIFYQPGAGVIVGNTVFHTDEHLSILPQTNMLNKGAAPFSTYSYADVLSGGVSKGALQNKIIIIGVTSNGLSQQLLLPGARKVSASELLAYEVSSLLNKGFYHTPPWVKFVVWLLFLVVAMSLFLSAKYLGLKSWIALTCLALGATLALQIVLLKIYLVWVPCAPVTVLFIVGFLVTNLWKLGTSERNSSLSQIESSESNKVLGLTYQNQGQLDLAFDKFKRCKPDDSVIEALYGLGLDFERKRLVHKASLVYQYIESLRPSFKDVAERITIIEKGLSSGVEFTVKDKNATLQRESLETAILEQPTIGRFNVEKEIGQGGMGAVYLGWDPKIQRRVAIKTLSFFNEFSGDLLNEAKNRFTREAMAVGKLNHPNIVTIYDVGEAHDLAYIAMEYLSGDDLSHHVHINDLLPVMDVLAIGIACADALEYAHNEGVIHRDIKPSNIIYNTEEKKSWLTDFGIAILLNSDATRTSSTIGSPRYMSPEQVEGGLLDGRSDIYSLGVTLFQLLVAQTPFQEGPAATVTHAIVNSPTPELLQVKSDIPKNISDTILKAMQKDKAHRYSSAAEMRDALKACLLSL